MNTFCKWIGTGWISIGAAAMLLMGNAQAQLSGAGDRFLVVGENLLKGAPDGTFGLDGMVAGDLDCDGRDDLVVLQPGSTVNVSGSNIAGGVVTVIPTRNQNAPQGGSSFEWHQGVVGVPGAVEAGDRFGASATIFDLSGDGCEDLFVGVPGEDIGGLSNAGAVQGFLGDAALVLGTAREGTIDGTVANETTGSSLVAKDGAIFRRLYVGRSGRNGPGPAFSPNVGIVTSHALILSGTLFLAADDLLADIRNLVGNPASSNHRWGSQMLASVGASLVALRGSGANEVSLISGGLGSLDQHEQRIPAAGELMATGDFDGDGRLEHVQQESMFGPVLTVRKLIGTTFVLASTIPSQLLPGVEFTSVQALAVGDFNRDGFDDLALGLPGIQSLSATTGNVLILSGSAAGLTTSNPQRLQQGVGGLLDSGESDDFFGSALAVGDWNGDGVDDLAVGVPGERVLTETRGGVHLIFGTAQPQLFASSFE
ncbi:MAG: FG-GAP repeat protein [Pseudomonadota bacterium]|nr:FG-GAP repeat protein [Pseudomonadota bacterium]